MIYFNSVYDLIQSVIERKNSQIYIKNIESTKNFIGKNVYYIELNRLRIDYIIEIEFSTFEFFLKLLIKEQDPPDFVNADVLERALILKSIILYDFFP